ncbi:GTP-binding protein [Lactarius sanguifluus]|nr:GTP-binding protein [Lactarius sanguifluus]
MHRQQPPRRIPNVKFRVLIIGRANAGKTSILQRVCDTTDSPIVYRGEEEVLRGPTFMCESDLTANQMTLEPSIDRGEHTIDDELVFSNHTGYVFHDSRGIESASTYELGILQSFIQRKCGERRLGDRLHAIWYCVPMDNQRPELDLRFFKDICPDPNVPVIAVFTKYDQFRKNIRINVEDFGSPDDDVSQVTEEHFQEYYLRPLGDEMYMQDTRCDELIETTAAALNEETTALMLLAVQRGNLELSVKTALKR